MSAFATGTAIGSWPGIAARPAAEVVVGELGGALTPLPELPARGIGADLIGRAGALLVDLAIDTTVRGYRLTARRGAVTRRAISLLGEDADALEEAWERAGLRGGGHPVKVQAPGPITLAAELELPNGHRALTDPGAVADLAASLAEGVAAHRADLARRLDVPVVVQFDEPWLSAAIAGRLTGVTALSPVAPLPAPTAVQLLDTVVAAAGAEVAVHSCATEVAWPVLQRSSVAAVAVDVTTPTAVDFDGIAEFVDSGRTVVLGLIPVTEPPMPRSVEQYAAAAAAITDRIGFPRAVLGTRVGVSPACGLASATAGWARTAIELAARTGELLTADPEAI